MARVKRGTIASKRRKNLLKYAKGFKWSRNTHYRAAKEALLHAWSKAYHDRKKKKGNFRTLWQIKVGAAAKQNGISYSRFIDALKKANVELDRKVLADIAENNPEVFAKIVNQVKTSK
ncbi:MAG: 50S ribosomal protein L20 [Patescibacteria group bacterium]